MKLLSKPYTQMQYNAFVDECNSDGKLRIERHNGNAYAMYDYEVYQDGEVIDLRNTPEYQALQEETARQERIEEIQAELTELDQKRIRAICEPEGVREDGTTWLEYYNEQVAALRTELNSIQ